MNIKCIALSLGLVFCGSGVNFATTGPQSLEELALSQGNSEAIIKQIEDHKQTIKCILGIIKNQKFMEKGEKIFPLVSNSQNAIHSVNEWISSYDSPGNAQGINSMRYTNYAFHNFIAYLGEIRGKHKTFKTPDEFLIQVIKYIERCNTKYSHELYQVLLKEKALKDRVKDNVDEARRCVEQAINDADEVRGQVLRLLDIAPEEVIETVNDALANGNIHDAIEIFFPTPTESFRPVIEAITTDYENGVAIRTFEDLQKAFDQKAGALMSKKIQVCNSIMKIINQQ